MLDLMDTIPCVAPFSAKLIDGINQSEARRRGLMLFCLSYLKANVKVRMYILFLVLTN